jgi:hypothetical protein
LIEKGTVLFLEKKVKKSKGFGVASTLLTGRSELNKGHEEIQGHLPYFCDSCSIWLVLIILIKTIVDTVTLRGR